VPPLPRVAVSIPSPLKLCRWRPTWAPRPPPAASFARRSSCRRRRNSSASQPYFPLSSVQ
jgi:hypothetical protein